MATVEVRLFANLREVAGTETLLLDFQEAPSVSQVLEQVLLKAPQLRRCLACGGKFNDYYKVLVGHEIIFSENFSNVKAGPQMAILPPVSGG